MREKLLQKYADKLSHLNQKNNVRAFYPLTHCKRHIRLAYGKSLLNLASNDYLGVATNSDWQAEFLTNVAPKYQLGASSSRLLTGNFSIYERLESRMQGLFGRSCLLFNSGYHANIGIIPALCDDGTMILADKLVHASMIDGIRLSRAQCVRYAHQDFVQLERLLQKYQDDDRIHQIVIMTESIFSMDGDVTDLAMLVRLKNRYDKSMLYVDEAHAIGTHGMGGLGCGQDFGVLDEIDLVVGAFGKAMGSMGAYVICHQVLKKYLINVVRPLIFSTALPPINVAWTDFVVARIDKLGAERQRLADLSAKLIAHVKDLGLACGSKSHIVPIVLKENAKALAAAKLCQSHGLFALAIRPPTVAINQARLRLCLNATISDDEFEKLQKVLDIVAWQVQS